VKQRALHVALRPRRTFSILERIDVGETSTSLMARSCSPSSFSILERIDVGETMGRAGLVCGQDRAFQYPRTDRRG